MYYSEFKLTCILSTRSLHNTPSFPSGTSSICWQAVGGGLLEGPHARGGGCPATSIEKGNPSTKPVCAASSPHPLQPMTPLAWDLKLPLLLPLCTSRLDSQSPYRFSDKQSQNIAHSCLATLILSCSAIHQKPTFCFPLQTKKDLNMPTSIALSEKDVNSALATTSTQQAGSKPDVKSMEYHRQILQSKMQGGE